jgi:hypothetical protein
MIGEEAADRLPGVHKHSAKRRVQAVLIRFEVEGEPVEYYRNWFTGGAELRAGGRVIPLQSALDPATQFSMSLTRVLKHRLNGHEITIEQVRPLLMAGFRPHDYRILVDGEVVVERRGY